MKWNLQLQWYRNLVLGLCLLIGLLILPAEQAHSESVVTDGDIVSDGVSLHLLREAVCQNASALGISPLPVVCYLGENERFIFATSTTSTRGGNLPWWAFDLLGVDTYTDGLLAGDAICQKHADDAGLPGSYRAWLSTSFVNAKDRIGDYSWRRRDGALVAESRSQLLSCTFQGPPCLQSMILAENGTIPPATVFTGTAEDGTGVDAPPPTTCDDWTNDSALVEGWLGLTGSTDYQWTSLGNAACNQLNIGLYCLQQ